MSRGRVYIWTPDPREPGGGRVQEAVVPLPDCSAHSQPRLCNRLVCVLNGGWVNDGASDDDIRAVPIGPAIPDANGDFLFESRRGGGRLDKVLLAKPRYRYRYIQASHFGEVNTYYHLVRIASYVEELLDELGAARLPQVTAVVNAHHGATETGGIRDGVRGTRQWLPFQGGHYRLSTRARDIAELNAVSASGEIHLGPGWQLLTHGALVKAAGGRYRANASHNAGIIYHEYGHHITRHMADFSANALRSPERQNNRKMALDEAICDYWAAAMLRTPHIWAWHRRHDECEVHPRSLVSRKTMADFDSSSNADAHANGTIWAAALWDLRSALTRTEANGARNCDLLVLKALLLIGGVGPGAGVAPGASIKVVRQARADFSTALSKLLEADEILFSSRHRLQIFECFSCRKIQPLLRIEQSNQPRPAAPLTVTLKRVPADEIPSDADLLSCAQLEANLQGLDETPISVLAVGDIMLGERTRSVIREHGSAYPFAGIMPLLRRSEIVFGNLEGPFAKESDKAVRNFSYRVDPKLASALAQANVKVVTLANNHLTDCGRDGVIETLKALRSAGVAPVGAAENETAAHVPLIRQVSPFKIGLLGYYWNRRTAATADLPGSAMGTPEHLQADIGALRSQVDRIVVEFHWGIPYQREPLPEDREIARFAVECGADVVVGHHPHVIQPVEVYRGRPIFYSVGNFTFGSGNSHAEGLMVGFRFAEEETEVQVYPIYVKNRDPRVNYQPKVLQGTGARRVLQQVAEMSGDDFLSLIELQEFRATLRLPRLATQECCA